MPRAAPTPFLTAGEGYEAARGASRRSWAVVDSGAAGIDRLAVDGQFGFLDEVFKESGIAWAERADVDIAKCYGLTLEDVQVGAFWNEPPFRLFRVDDVKDLR